MAEKASLKNGGGELSQELWGSRLECLAADGTGLGEVPYRRQLAALYGWRVGSTDRDRSGSDCRVEDPSVGEERSYEVEMRLGGGAGVSNLFPL